MAKHNDLEHLSSHRKSPISTPIAPEIPFREYRPSPHYPNGWQPRDGAVITFSTIKPQTLRDHLPPPREAKPALHQIPAHRLHSPEQLAAGSAVAKTKAAQTNATDAAVLGLLRYGPDGARMRVSDHLLRILQDAGRPLHTRAVANQTRWSRDACYHALMELLDAGKIKRRRYRAHTSRVQTTYCQWALPDAEWPPLPVAARLMPDRCRPRVGRSAA